MGTCIIPHINYWGVLGICYHHRYGFFRIYTPAWIALQEELEGWESDLTISVTKVTVKKILFKNPEFSGLFICTANVYRRHSLESISPAPSRGARQGGRDMSLGLILQWVSPNSFSLGLHGDALVTHFSGTVFVNSWDQRCPVYRALQMAAH